ncbi:type IV secretory system conjugative DNA transfer family protein [Isoptericola croceus]|uniref:type IV secretory system conjugative DNA transfer family protein n=1 Tax=Isoptericola croceus TaxID=3031406 RepID=UPI0023F7AD6E|nr:type IV secretory system conjugative DNA transfer family protein [Isoptericola croceus]
MTTSDNLAIWRLAPAGSGDLDPATITQRAGMFTAAGLGSPAASLTLLVVRTTAEHRSFLITPDTAAAATTAEHLGRAVGARLVRDDLPDLTGQRIGTLSFRPGGAVTRETQAGTDPGEAARLLQGAMTPGQWVAITLRTATSTEAKRHQAWLAARLGTATPTHHSMSSAAVSATVHVAASSAADVRSLGSQVAAAMPGFDLLTRTVMRTHADRARGWLVLAATVTVWATLTLVLDRPWWGLGLGASGILVALAARAGLLDPTGRALSRAVARGRFPAPARRPWWSRVRPPTKEHTDAEGKVHGATDGDYPMHPTTFRLGAHLPVGLVVPHTGAMSGSSATSSRPVPPPLRERIGPLIGHDTHGTPVYLSSQDRPGGCFLVGRKGSGKSMLLGSVFAYDSLDRVRPSGLPGTLGAQQSQIAFENKGEGATTYLRWASTVGDRTLLIDAADPDSYAIDLLATGGTWSQRGDFFANMLKYIFTDGAVGNSSFMALSSFGAAALALTETPEGRAVLNRLEHTRAEMSPLELMYVLVGGRGDDAAVELDAEVRSEAVAAASRSAEVEALTFAAAQLRPYYGGNTPSSRRDAVAPPRNKIYALLSVDHFFSPQRRRVTWEQVLEGHRSVVINTGPPVSGAATMLTEEITTQLSGMVMYSLRDAIARRCTGWQAAGRGVNIYADELALLAGSSPETITWLHDQGRSFGVRTVFATQRPTQLDPRVREAAMDFSTLIAFNQANTEAARPIVEDLAADGSTWAPHDVVNLEPFTGVCRSTYRQRRLPAFTFAAAYFEDDPAAFAARQGWVSTPEGPAS